MSLCLANQVSEAYKTVFQGQVNQINEHIKLLTTDGTNLLSHVNQLNNYISLWQAFTELLLVKKTTPKNINKKIT